MKHATTVAVLALLFCGTAAADSGEVVAKLGSAELHLGEVRRLLDAQPPELRRQATASTAALDRLVRTEVLRRALLAEAKAKGWDKRPELAEQLERAREQVIVASYVNSLARPPADYPNAEEIAAAYKAAEAELTAPRQFRLQQIFVPLGSDAEAVRRKAEDLARRAREKGADFAALARADSGHRPSAEKGGDMGWIAEPELVPELRSVVAALGVEQVSAPVRSAEGYHVLRLAETKPAALRPLAEVRDALVAALRARRARENEQRHLDQLLAKSALSVNEIALDKLVSRP